jgi:hypothetical protein
MHGNDRRILVAKMIGHIFFVTTSMFNSKNSIILCLRIEQDERNLYFRCYPSADHSIDFPYQDDEVKKLCKQYKMKKCIIPVINVIDYWKKATQWKYIIPISLITYYRENTTLRQFQNTYVFVAGASDQEIEKAKGFYPYTKTRSKDKRKRKNLIRNHYVWRRNLAGTFARWKPSNLRISGELCCVAREEPCSPS